MVNSKLYFITLKVSIVKQRVWESHVCRLIYDFNLLLTLKYNAHYQEADSLGSSGLLTGEPEELTTAPNTLAQYPD